MGAKRGLHVDITALHQEVTGSCLYVSVHYADERHVNFIVDCGLFQEVAYNHLNTEPFPFRGENVKFALITHNHADHMGRLPMLVKSGFTGKIYMSEPTAKLLPIAIQNSYAIMKEEYKKLNKKPLYGDEEVEAVYNQTSTRKYEDTMYIDENISITFFNNAHLVGASMILVQISERGERSINILFTGDYKRENLLKPASRLPEWVLRKQLTVVTESTYGTTKSSDVEHHFEADVEELVKQKKNLLISATAQGRAQELLYILKKMQEDGRLSPKVQIGLDGTLAHKYTELYRSGMLEVDKDKLDFLPRSFHKLSKDNREEFYANNMQKIIVCTSGMLDHGPAQIYLPRVLERTDWAVYITCYCPETTFGYKLQHAKDGRIKLRGKEIKIKAKVYSTAEYSAHAKADEIEDFIKKFQNPVLVLLNHGDRNVSRQFALDLECDCVARRVEVLGLHTVRVANFGCVKVMGSKLKDTSKNFRSDKPKLSKKQVMKKRRSLKPKLRTYKKQGWRR